MPQLKPSLTQVLPKVWSWSAFSEEKQMNFNGHVLQLPGGLAIVDPPPASPAILSQISSLGQPSIVILTNRDHERESVQFKNHFCIPAAIHEFDAPLLSFSPDIVLTDGQLLMDAIKITHLPNQKSPGESALYLDTMRLLILGDALIGKPSGKLNLLPDDKYQDVLAAKESLKKLLTLEFEYLLLGDGESLMDNARSELGSFLTGSPEA